MDNLPMPKIARMGRKPLGKEKYHFTAPPDLMARFDAIAAGLGTTRSDLLVRMIQHEIVANPAAPAPALRDRRAAAGPARGRGSK